MKRNKKRIGRRNIIWTLKMFTLTLLISSIFSYLSGSIFKRTNNFILPLSIIFVIILIGVIFDIIGIAVTSAKESPFNAMSSKRIKGSKEALFLIKNADFVSNVCNDVIGDICGIISGAAGSMLVIKLVLYDSMKEPINIVISSIIAALTVGGKALGKNIAINYSHDIVYAVGYIISFLPRKDGKK